MMLEEVGRYNPSPQSSAYCMLRDPDERGSNKLSEQRNVPVTAEGTGSALSTLYVPVRGLKAGEHSPGS